MISAVPRSHFTRVDRFRKPMGREKKLVLGCLIFGTRTIQPFSQKSLTATVPKVFQIGLRGVVEADLELFCNSWSVGFLENGCLQSFSSSPFVPHDRLLSSPNFFVQKTEESPFPAVKSCLVLIQGWIEPALMENGAELQCGEAVSIE